MDDLLEQDVDPRAPWLGPRWGIAEFAAAAGAGIDRRVIAGHQAATAEWWDDRRLRYDVYVSPLVVEEISAGDAAAAEERLRVIAGIPSVAVVAEAESLAFALLASNAVPANSARDALHIAIAATQGID